MIPLEGESKWNRNGVIGETADHREGTLILLSFERLAVEVEEVSEGRLTNINEKSGFGLKDEDVPEERTLARHLTVKKLQEIFYDIESMKGKMLRTDPNLGMTMTIRQGTEKMLDHHGTL